MFFKKLIPIFCLSFLFLAIGYVGSYAEEGRWEEPWPGEASRPFTKEESPTQVGSAGQRAAEELFRFFQKYISPVDGDRCPSYPTCSQYGLEAVRKHGLLVGFVMTFDRLIHESDEIRSAPLIRVYESHKYYDPVENNDFWWDGKKVSHQRSAVSDQQEKKDKEEAHKDFD